MAINSKVTMRAQGEFTDEGRQEFIVAIGCYGSESVFYVGREQMTDFLRKIEAAIASADRQEGAVYAAQEKEAA